jgi:hypothetical protein
LTEGEVIKVGGEDDTAVDGGGSEKMTQPFGARPEVPINSITRLEERSKTNKMGSTEH